MLRLNSPADSMKLFHIDVSTPTSSRNIFADVWWLTFGLGETRRIFGPPLTGNIVRITNKLEFAGTLDRTLTLCEVKVYGDYGKVVICNMELLQYSKVFTENYCATQM